MGAGERERCRTSFAYWTRYARTAEGPHPPWQYLQGIADVLDTDRDTITLKRRQCYLSIIFQLAIAHNSRFNPMRRSAVVSFAQAEADMFGQDLLTSDKLAGTTEDSSEPPLWIPPTGSGVMIIKYPNGSRIRMLAATATAGVGGTYDDFVMDEFSKHPYAEANFISTAAAIRKRAPHLDRRRGRRHILSTSHPDLGEGTYFHTKWQEAANAAAPFWPERESFADWRERVCPKALPAVIPIFVGRYCRPDQPREAPDGEEHWLEEERRQLMRQGERADDVALRVYYPETPDDAFYSNRGLVYGVDVLDEARNRRPARVPWEQCLWRIAAIDPGGTDPSAIMFVGVSRSKDIHVYGSYGARRAIDAFEAHAVLSAWDRRGAINAVVVDRTNATLVATLAAMRSPRGKGWPAESSNSDRALIATVSNLFRTGILTIDPSDEATWRELKTYWHDDNPREKAIDSGRYTGARVRTATPNWHHGERPDCLRYAVAYIIERLPRNTPAPQIVSGAALTVHPPIHGARKPRPTGKLAPWDRARQARGERKPLSRFG